MKTIHIGVVLVLKVVFSLKTLDGKLPTINGNGIPLNIDIDVSEFNRKFADIVNKGIPEEISDIFHPHVNSAEFKEDMKRMTDFITKASEIRPAFFVSIIPHPYTLTGINDVVKFDTVKVNIGGGYDKSTGIFTAGRKGLYQISCTILGDDRHEVHYMLAKNGAEYIKGYSARGPYTSSTINAVIVMYKGDRVCIKHRWVHTSEQITGVNHSSFSGHFLQNI